MEWILETKSLLLRNFALEDASFMLALNDDSEVQKFTGDLPFRDVREVERFIIEYLHTHPSYLSRWTMLHKESSEYLGWCGLNKDFQTGEVDLGFRLLKSARNQGYATEGAIACLEYGFNKIGLERIIGRARIENKASIRVLEKAGMKFENELVYLGGTSLLFSLIKTDHARITDK